jgi:hypothetical protein
MTGCVSSTFHRPPLHGSRLALLSLIALALTGCASIANRYVATPVDEQGRALAGPRTSSGLVVTGEELKPYASELFGLVEVTFENTSTEWVRIQDLTLNFGSTVDQDVFLPEGEDIDAWYSATSRRNDIRDTNKATALGAILFASSAVAVAGGASGSSEAAVAGTSVALGTASAAGLDAQAERIDRAEHGDPRPGSHLLTVPFSVPPGLFTKKWILINTRRRDAPCAKTMLIDYVVQGGGRERVALTFRRPLDGSEWQRKSCGAERASPRIKR